MEIAMLKESDLVSTIDNTVLPMLEQCRTSGYMEPARETFAGRPLPQLGDLGRLHYVCYDVHEFQKLNIPGASRKFHGAIVISHGFSEFAAKYAELAWYFLLGGFSVCILEHRGHGYSARDVDNRYDIYIDDWRRYIADYAKFADTIGRQYAQGCRLSLFSHSMGGGIAAAMMERYPKVVDRAVLSSPMIAPQTGVPNWMAAGITGLMCDLGFGKSKTVGQHDFEPEINMKDNPGCSKERVRWFQDLRIADPHYQTCAATNSWVKNAVQLSHAILQPSMIQRMQTPVLLFQAGRDLWVQNVAQNKYKAVMDQYRRAIELDRIPQSAHEVFSMPNNTYAPYLRRILNYLQSSENVTVLE